MGRNRILLILAVCAVLGAATTARALTLEDLCVYYPLDETSGSVIHDAGPNGLDASFYRAMRASEMPGLDASGVTQTGQFGTSIGLGTRSIDGTSNEVVGLLDSVAGLPVLDDAFAVSFWAKPTSSWANGLLMAYKSGDLECNVAYNGGFVAYSSNSSASTGNFWGNAISSLSTSAYHHFVVQFSGTSGITDVWIDNASQTDNGTSTYYWGNRNDGLCVGGRNIDPRDFTAGDYVMDDLAIINGTVTSTDVGNLYTSGAASLGASRLLHYTMDQTTGTTLVDASGNGHDARLVGYTGLTSPAMGVASRDVVTATEPGKFDTAVKFAEGWDESGRMDPAKLAASMPEAGEAFTVSLWYKLDDSQGRGIPGTNAAGWDNSGMIVTWSANGVGFGLCQATDNAGSIIARTTDGTASGGSDAFGVNVGPTGTGALNLSTSEYHHIAVTVGADRKITGIYIDGVLQSETITSNGLNLTDAGTGLVSGRFTNGTFGYDCSGYVDDLAVFKGQLTPEQVADVMTRGVAAACVPEPSVMAILLGLFATLLVGRRFRG